MCLDRMQFRGLTGMIRRSRHLRLRFGFCRSNAHRFGRLEDDITGTGIRLPDFFIARNGTEWRRTRLRWRQFRLYVGTVILLQRAGLGEDGRIGIRVPYAVAPRRRLPLLVVCLFVRRRRLGHVAPARGAGQRSNLLRCLGIVRVAGQHPRHDGARLELALADIFHASRSR